jgi:hypothetical protein
VDPVADTLLLRKSGDAGKRTRELWIRCENLKSYTVNYLFSNEEKAMDNPYICTMRAENIDIMLGGGGLSPLFLKLKNQGICE